jgi:sterol desaturase/sphingolipid hydroxylase (fatty acid hydroxylase superfamily)
MSDLLHDPRIASLLLSLVRQAAWLVLLAIVFLPLEGLFAVRRRRVLGRSVASDLGFFFLSGLVPSLLFTPVLVMAALLARRIVPAGIHEAVAHMPVWARAGAALLISEVGFYWGHRWSHAVPLLWRFHAVHHAPEELYFLVSARAHPVDNAFIRLCGLIPVTMLGLVTPLTPAGGALAAFVVIVITLWGFLIHANLRWRFGPLEWLLATPLFHHWHHTADEPRDRNFASMLPCMDWLFGTLHMPPREWPAAYGTDARLPRSLLGQLIHPFVRDWRSRPAPTGGERVEEPA